METEKLYYADPFLTDFTATVLDCQPGKNGYLVTLDRTAFYPEGGGQPADHGVLDGAAVTDVHEKNGVILHNVDRAVEIGKTVTGTIDWGRRFDHMQQHSGEHICSGLICERFHCDNVGFHMGADIVTINCDPAIGYIVEAGQQGAYGCLTAAGRTDQCDGSAGRNINGYMGENGCLIVAVMEGDIFIADMTFHIGKIHGIRCILNIRHGFHNIKKTAETGKTLLHHFHKFHQDLDGADKDSDIQGIHGKICSLHFTLSDQIAAVNKSYQVHHALEEKIGTHEASHAVIIISFGNKERFIAFLKFGTFDVLVCEGLHHADSGKRILKTGIYISDLTTVFHEGFLHGNPS